MNLLIVDDEPLTIKMLRKKIPWESIPIDEVYTANDTVTARQLITSCPIQIILCDIEMPGESGIEFLRWVKENIIYTPVVILLTCHDDFKYAQDGIRLGVMDYLVKPVAFSQLTQTLQKAVSEVRKRNSETACSPKLNLAPENTMDAHLLEKITNYIRKHLSEEISRQDIADYVHLNQDYLSRIFKKKTGINLTDYIRTERLNYGKYLLRNTELSISQIAMATGFNAASYFSSSFKKEFDCSPADYRNRH